MNTVKTILALCLFGLAFYYAWPLAKNYLPQDKKVQASEGVQWIPFSPEEVKKATAQGRPVIIDFYADWCAACVEMEELTFSKTGVQELSQKFVMLKVDATSPFPELTEWQTTYEIYGLPTMIFIDAKGKIRKDLTLTGFEEAPLFIKRMNTALKN